MVKWHKAVKSRWSRLPYPGHWEPVSGYTCGRYFVHKSNRVWSVSYVGPDDQLIEVGKPRPTGTTTSDFNTLREAKTAVQRLLDSGFGTLPDYPDQDYLARFTSVLTQVA